VASKTLTTEDVARYCQVSQFTVLRWVEQGTLPAHRISGSGYLVPEAAFRSFLARRGMSIDGLCLANAGGRRRVLVVADEDQSRSIVSRLCARSAVLEIASANDWHTTECQLASFRPDLVILDTMLPGLDGCALCRQIKRRRASRHIKVLVLNGALGTEDARRFQRAGADEALPRSLDSLALWERVCALLDTASTASVQTAG